MGDIANDTGAGLDIRHLASGTDVIAVFPSGTFVISGLISNTVGVSGTSFNTVWLGTGSVVISGTSQPTWRGVGSVVVSGTVPIIGSLAISNFNALGSSVVISAGSIQTYNPLGSQNIIQQNNLTLFNRAIDISSGTLLKIISGNVGSTINVWGYEIIASAASTIQWVVGSPGSIINGPQQFAANGGVVSTVQPPFYLLTGMAGSDIWITLTAGSLGGRVNYYLTG